MQRRRVLIPLLFLAVAAVDVVALTIYFSAVDQITGRTPHWPEIGPAIFLALICAQISLVAVWSGLARPPVPWPIAVAVVVVLTWGLLLAEPVPIVFHGFLNTASWAAVLAVQALALAGPLWIVRLHRMRMGKSESADRSGRAPALRRSQFTIANLLSAAAALAVVLGFCRWITQVANVQWIADLAELRGRILYDMVTLVAANVVIAWAATWAALSDSTRWLKVAAVPCAVALVLGYLATFVVDAEHAWGTTAFYTTQTAILIAGLAVLRIDGYRLGKQSGKRKAESGLPPEP